MLKIILLLKFKSLKAQLQYPVSFLTQVISVSLIGFLRIPALLILTYTFPTVGGWDFWRLGFMAALGRMAHGVHHALFFSFFSHREMVHRGEFDRLLVRPVPPVFQIMASSLNLSALGEFIPGLVLLLITAPQARVAWTPLNLLYLIIVVLSGAVIEWAVNLFFMTFDFWLEQATLLWLPDIFLGQSDLYPIHIYGDVLSFILTFVFPYAFIAYYPTHHFFQLEGELLWRGFAYLTPVVATGMVVISLAFWTIGLRRYQSTGT
ncbi:MAG: ABC-2 family transporter protein [Anaerolineae bacterium]|nr:ABC-2 family transporter protein [Anaerolineae bacterium]